MLRSHGLVWPFNAHFHLPVLDPAAGGSVLTGIGGDELFGRVPWSSARALLAGPSPRRPRLWAKAAALAIAPTPVPRWAIVRQRRLRFPWLRPASEADVSRRLADLRARTPIPWHRAVEWWWQIRYCAMLQATMATLVPAAWVQVVHPRLG